MSAEELTGLLFDFERYVAAEPRLRSARWLDVEHPGAGARAEVHADIPYKLPLVRRALGAPEVLVTVTHWDPPRVVGVDLSGEHFTGDALVTLVPAAGGCRVDIRGVVRPHRRGAAVVLRPAIPLLEQLATQALGRGVARAVTYLEAER